MDLRKQSFYDCQAAAVHGVFLYCAPVKQQVHFLYHSYSIGNGVDGMLTGAAVRRISMTLLLFLMIFLLQGCGGFQKNAGKSLISENTGVGESSEPTKKNGIRVALVMKTLTNPFFTEMEKGARKAESEFGINLLVRTGAQETSIEQQISIVEDLINSGIDAIVIAPGHSVDLIPVLKKAQDAGIAIVNIDNRLDPVISKKMGLNQVPFISVDNRQAAYEAVKYLCGTVSKPVKAAILEGIRGAENSEQRRQGAVKAFKEKPEIDLVTVETANWKIDEAFEVTSRIIKKYPDIGVIYCENDMMALGALECLSKNNRTHILVGGYDALEEARQAVEEGKLRVTVDQQAELQGYTGVSFAVKILKKEKVPMETYIPFKLVN